jgi:hypothetical protein
MNVLEQLALAGQALRLALRELRTGGLWTPWLALGVLQLALLLALTGFAHPLLAWAMAPLVRALAGEPALHYPDFYRALPYVQGRLDLAVGMLPGALATGWSTRLFAARWRRSAVAPGAAWEETAPCALTLVLAQLPLQALMLLFTTTLERALVGQPGLVRRLGEAAILGGVVGLQALFLYVPALVVLGRRGLWSTLAGLPRTWARGLWAGLLLCGVAQLGLLPLGELGQRSSLLVDRGAPELVAWVTGLQVLVGLALSFVLAGSATLVYLGTVADEPGEEG